MKTLIDKLYDETYSPKLTPETLLSNLNLPNYTGISFNKSKEFIVASTFCLLQDGVQAEYRYHFKENLLFFLESVIDDKIQVIYDREEERKKLATKVSKLAI